MPVGPILGRALGHAASGDAIYVIPAKAGIHVAYPLPQALVFNPPTRPIKLPLDLKKPCTCNFLQSNLPELMTHLPQIFAQIQPISQTKTKNYTTTFI
jgi:hypothetical protein